MADIWNITWKVTQYFDTVNPTYGPHNAIDWATPKGTPIYAVGDGVISRSDTNDPAGGLRIGINLPDGWNVDYAHLDQSLVTVGQPVKKGQLIGYTGNSGSATTGPNLHFSAKKNGTLVNPENVFNPFAGDNRIAGLADAISGITKEALALLPSWAKQMPGTQAYNGSRTEWKGLPLEVSIPGNRSCSDIATGGYSELTSPSFGNPEGTKVCTLPWNPVADAAATGGDVAAGLAEVGAFFADVGAFLFDGTNWIRIGALIAGGFLSVRGLMMVLQATGTNVDLGVPTPKLPGVG